MRTLIALALLVMLLAPVAAEAQTVYEWCYRFDLMVQNPFAVQQGLWVSGYGVRSVGSGQLSVVYSRPTPITVGLAIIEMRYYWYNGQAPNIFTNVSIFGWQTTLTQAVGQPGATELINEYYVYTDNEQVGNFFALSSAMFADTKADLRAVSFVGTGQNPFGQTNCSLANTSLATQTPVPLGWDGNLSVEALATANASLSQYASIDTSYVPNPALGNLFKYLKWIISPVAAQELSGPFYPVLSRIGVALFILMSVTAVYVVVYIVVTIVKWVVWVFSKLMQLVQTVRALIPFI